MKTPDKIKKGLECCVCIDDRDTCQDCPYNGVYPKGTCINDMCADGLAYIQQLEQENANLKEMLRNANRHIKGLEAERDAAVSELPHSCWNCKYHLNNPIEETDDKGRTIHRYCDADCCFPDEENSSWEWRGLCKENGGADNAPTVDAVEVVRCKDCIHFMPKANRTVGFCKCGEAVGHHPMMRVAIDFCSHGER